MTQPDAYRTIRCPARRVGIEMLMGSHSVRATGITDYLKNQGTLENAHVMANDSSPRTTKLYGLLKALKRQMYSLAAVALLRIRMLPLPVLEIK
jgi:hypothetical protein